MAAGQGQIRGRSRFISELLVPRQLTLFLLMSVGFAAAHVAWLYLPAKLIAYLSGIAGPFCMLCATAIWSMRDKVESALDPELMNAAMFRRSRIVTRDLRARSMYQASVAAVCALAAASAAISLQLTNAMWHWMALLGGVGIGRAAFGYLLANQWEADLNAYRDAQIQRSKEEAEQKALEERLEASSDISGSFPGWQPSGELQPLKH